MGSTWLTNGIGPVLLFSILLSPVRQGNGATVNTCDEPNLRAALAGGGTVTLACDGTIHLATTLEINQDTILDAQDHQVAISGGNAVRVFRVAPSVQFTLKGVTIANGRSTNGAAIFNDQGFVSILGCTLTNNAARGSNAAVWALSQQGFTYWWFVPGTEANGGAVFNRGSLNVGNSIFLGNLATGGNGSRWYEFTGITSFPVADGTPGYDGFGGAIYNEGSLRLTRCSFINNQVSGGDGGLGAPAFPRYNRHSGSPGASAGNAWGGALFNRGIVEMSSCTLVSNKVNGGAGGVAGWGSDGYVFGLPSNYQRNGGNGGHGGDGGNGLGGALCSMSGGVFITNTTLYSNAVFGGPGGDGGSGGNTSVSSTNYGGNGGAGGKAGDAYGGGLHIATNGMLLNATIAGGVVTGGTNGLPGAAGSPGPSQPGAPALPSRGLGGAFSGSHVQLINSILSASPGSSNCFGSLVDGGHNLCSDGSCNLTNIGSLNDTDPRLAPLGDNGGQMLTLALLSDSPAIDGGDPSSYPPVDQRGVARPLGLLCDIGAFEWFPEIFSIRSIALSGATGLRLRGIGIPNQPFRLESSDGFSNWEPVYSGTVSAAGSFLIDTSRTTTAPTRKFFRTVAP